MPTLEMESLEAYNMARLSLVGAAGGMGGIQFDAVHYALQSFGLEPGSEEYRSMFRACLVYVTNFLDVSRPQDSGRGGDLRGMIHAVKTIGGKRKGR